MFLDRAYPERSPDEKALRAEVAKRMLSDAFFQSVMEETETKIIISWVQAKDVETRERARALLAALHAIPETILGIIAEGPMTPVDKPEPRE